MEETAVFNNDISGSCEAFIDSCHAPCRHCCRAPARRSNNRAAHNAAVMPEYGRALGKARWQEACPGVQATTHIDYFSSDTSTVHDTPCCRLSWRMTMFSSGQNQSVTVERISGMGRTRPLNDAWVASMTRE